MPSGGLPCGCVRSPTPEQAGADAVVRVDVDYESIQMGQGGGMLMVSAPGTAVKL